MTVKACNVRIYVNEFDMTAKSNVALVDSSTNAIEYSVFGDCAILKLPDLTMLMFEHGGFFTTGAAGELEAEIKDALATESDCWVAFVFGTLYDTPPVYMMPATFAQQLRLNAQTSNLITVNGTWKTRDGSNLRGYEIANATISATGATSGKDFNAAGDTGRAFLFVQAITGTATDATIQLQGDTDSGFSSPTTLGTFTFSAVGVYELTLGSTVQRYLRLNTTDLGGATDFDVACVVCSKDVTY